MTDLDAIVDDVKYAAYINSSDWPYTRIIGLRNITELLQMLVYDEVVRKRFFATKAFFNGLEHTGVGSLLQNNFDVMRKAFVYTSTKLTDLISTKQPFEVQQPLFKKGL